MYGGAICGDCYNSSCGGRAASCGNGASYGNTARTVTNDGSTTSQDLQDLNAAVTEAKKQLATLNNQISGMTLQLQAVDGKVTVPSTREDGVGKAVEELKKE